MLFNHRWQLASDLVYEDKIFRTKFDKEFARANSGIPCFAFKRKSLDKFSASGTVKSDPVILKFIQCLYPVAISGKITAALIGLEYETCSVLQGELSGAGNAPEEFEKIFAYRKVSPTVPDTVISG